MQLSSRATIRSVAISNISLRKDCFVAIFLATTGQQGVFLKSQIETWKNIQICNIYLPRLNTMKAGT